MASRGGGSGGARAQLRGGLGTAGHSPEHRRGGGWDAGLTCCPCSGAAPEGWAHDPADAQAQPYMRAITAAAVSSLAVKSDEIKVNPARSPGFS